MGHWETVTFIAGLAQESLQEMEHQLDGVKVRRILRQVAQACASSPDRLLYPSNLMEGYIVGITFKSRFTPVGTCCSIGSLESNARVLAGLRNGLNESGFVESRNVSIEVRWEAEGRYERLVTLATDLVRLPVNVLIAMGSARSAHSDDDRPDRVRERQRSGQGRPCPQPEPAGWQSHSE
jgi:hypothetical protein